MYKWTCAVATHVVQGSTVFSVSTMFKSWLKSEFGCCLREKYENTGIPIELIVSLLASR